MENNKHKYKKPVIAKTDNHNLSQNITQETLKIPLMEKIKLMSEENKILVSEFIDQLFI